MFWFWGVVAALALLASALILVPVRRAQRDDSRNAISGPLVALAVVPLSVGLYLFVTTYDAELADEVRPEQFAMLEQLAARLADDPDDPDGWILLGRSYLQLGDYSRARLAFDQAWARLDEADAAFKLEYAQALLFTEQGAARGLAGELVDDVLETAPANPAALFFGGLVALERNDPAEARRRWDALLATNPPPEVANAVRSQLLALADASGEETPSGPTIELDVSVADEIPRDRFGPGARVFLIARAADSPAPIAVINPPLDALPDRFTLSDADAMIPGRSLSQYDEVTVVARISQTGEPTEQSGDAFAEATVTVGAAEPVTLVIDQLVP